MSIHDFTQEAALLQRKPRWWQLPFMHLWTLWQHFSYFFAPANQCQYCWVLRMFILGLLLGWHVTYIWMKQ